MERIFGDLGTMRLGIATILIASVIINCGTVEGPKLAPVIGFTVLIAVGVILRLLSEESSEPASGC